jgi:hypothetical protein
MTICIAVAVYDGIVFAADSASSMIGRTQQGQPQITNVYRNGNKVFNLVRGHPLVAMTCGMGNFGRAPIATLSKDLRKLLSNAGNPYSLNLEDYTLRDVATKAQLFFKERFDVIDPKPDNPHTFQYWIGGFGSSSDLHEIWEFKIVNGEASEASRCIEPGDAGLIWSGQPEAVTRLVMGYSPSIGQALVQAGIAEDNVQKLLQAVAPLTQASLVNEAMPIPDAIDLADFLADTTKRFVRFLPGADTVGGEIDIATVTRHERFKWIRRKHYYPAKLNPLEIDHV